jgi:hypothetical protein
MEAELRIYKQVKALNKAGETLKATVESKLGNKIVRNVKNKSRVSDRMSGTKSTSNR